MYTRKIFEHILYFLSKKKRIERVAVSELKIDHQNHMTGIHVMDCDVYRLLIGYYKQRNCQK